VAALLLVEQLLQALHQGFEAAEFFNLVQLLGAQEFFRQLLEPFLGQVLDRHALGRLEALEHLAEDAVEAVEVALVLHQGGAAEVVEVIDGIVGHARLHGAHEGEVLGDGGREAGRAKGQDEGREHRKAPLSRERRNFHHSLTTKPLIVTCWLNCRKCPQKNYTSQQPSIREFYFPIFSTNHTNIYVDHIVYNIISEFKLHSPRFR